MSSSRSKYYGKEGEKSQVYTNSFIVTTLPSNDFYHYDVAFDVKLDRRRKLEIVDKMQIQYPQLFNPRAAYDGESNMFRSQPLNLPNNSATLTVYRGNVEQAKARRAKGINVLIKQVARINPSCLRAVMEGRGKMQSEEQTSMTLLNVLIRMGPVLTYPSNARSFFTNASSNIGQGLEVWRGYFQAVKLSVDHLLINVDISTTVMYQGGQLIDVVKLHLNCRNNNDLFANRISQSAVRSLTRFLKGLLVYSTVPRLAPGASPKTRPIKEIVVKGADDYEFEKDEETMTITEYFRRTYNYNLGLGKAICIGFGRGIVYPIEVLRIKEGQFYKKRLSPALTSSVLTSSVLKAHKRLEEIQKAPLVLKYHQSDFLAHAGFTVDTTQPLLVQARVLPTPSLQYKSSRTNPKSGGWNVLGQGLYDSKTIRSWGFVLFTRMHTADVERFAFTFREACRELGMSKFQLVILDTLFEKYPEFPDERPPVIEANPQGNIESQLSNAGKSISEQFRGFKPLLFIIVPDSAADIIARTKSWGDCTVGCATQCVKGSKLLKANNQYHNNVALKVNIRMGGVNWIPAEHLRAAQWFNEEPTMVIGADVGHAGAGSNKPSVSGLVSSVDGHMSRYVASTAVQECRQEFIDDLESMVEHAITTFNEYRKQAEKLDVFPKRILFYRDGLSDGQFEVIAREEIKILRNVIKSKGLQARLVYIVVGKRHHVRFFPRDNQQADRSGNCPAGLVVDRGIVHPIDHDFYLQSHGGILGTSRSAHYTVIHDELNMHPDAIQNISYALCHVYGRATRSVSIPAPVYYADLVCRRGKFHSSLLREGDDGSSVTSSDESLDNHKRSFVPINPSMGRTMYWI